MKKLFFIFSLLYVFCTNTWLKAQYCTPTYTNACSSDDFINNFTLNTISNLNSSCNGLANNYQYTGISTILTLNETYTLSIQSGALYDQGFGIWIDYNQNGTFKDAGEFVYASPFAGTNFFVDSITIPATAAKGTTRMRVLCAYSMVITDTMYCSALTYGETEDYDVVIVSADSPPIANFIADVSKSCDGNVNFTDQSSSKPLSWKWDFGDGKADTTQNPTHSYLDTGRYTVTLTVTNSFGSDTIQKTNIYQKLLSEKLNVSIDFESGVSSIKNYQIVDNTESNVLVDAASGNSSNFGLILDGNSASSWTNPAAGDEFTTNPLHNSSVTLCLDATTSSSLFLIFDMKLIYEYQNFYTNFRISANGAPVSKTYQPDAATTGWSTEVIDLSAYAGSVFELSFEASCKYFYNYGGLDIGNGVYIDNVIIQPMADFYSDVTSTCNGEVNFINTSILDATSFYWDFGDGISDTAINPTHSYSLPGIYTVKLVSSNLTQSDTSQKINYINVLTPNVIPYQQDFETGITILSNYNVSANNESYVTIADTGSNLSSYGLILAGKTATAWTNPNPGEEFIINPEHFSSVSLCIDASNDSSLLLQFDYKLIYQYQNNYTNFRITANGNQIGSIYQPTGANTVWKSEILDLSSYVGGIIDVSFEANCNYSYNNGGQDNGNAVYIDNVVIKQLDLSPVAEISSDITTTCDGIVNFIDASGFSPTSWNWNFGDGTSDTSQNPTHLYSKIGSYSVSLIATNIFGSDTIVKTNYISIIGVDSMPYFNDFELDTTLNNFLTIKNSQSEILIGNGLGQAGTYALVMGGNSAASWTNPTQGNEFNINPLHFASATLCADASSYSSLFLIFNYKLNYYFQNNYTNFRITANGNQVGNVYQPAGETSGWNKATVDLSSFTGGKLNISFETNCKYTYDYNGMDAGNGVYIDSIILREVDVPPIPDFASTSPYTCDGVVGFTDKSLYSPNGWLWDFGDGITSTAQNPSHIYTKESTYTVTLIVSNKVGNSTIIKTDYIKVDFGGSFCDTLYMKDKSVQLDSSCTGVIFDDGGSSGYYSNGVSSRITIKPTNAIRVGIQFSEFRTESNVDYLKIYNGPNTSSPLLVNSWGDILPNNGDLIISSDSNITLEFKTDLSQADKGFALTWQCFYLTLPEAMFETDKVSACLGDSIFFSDASQNFPEGWYWDFGDGNSSTAQNPVHFYSDTGYFTITMVATNAKGNDTVKQVNHILIKKGPGNPSCNADVAANCCGVGIHHVVYNTIDYTSTEEVDYYQDLTCSQLTTVLTGGKDTIRVFTGTVFEENVRVWVDYNNDSTFDETAELVFVSDNKKRHKGVIRISGTAVTNQLLRMRIASDYSGVAAPSPCTKLAYGQIEDYGVVVKKVLLPPDVDFAYTVTDFCNYTVSFADFSAYQPTDWIWDFGDNITVSGEDTVTHQYNRPGTYRVTMIASNVYGSDTIIKKIFLDSIIVDFGIAQDTIRAGDTIQFTNLCYNTNKWIWNFGDTNSTGIKNTDISPFYSFQKFGNYNVLLIATNNKTSCSDSLIKMVTVLPPTSVSELIWNKNIHIIPVPSNGQFEIFFSDISEKDISVQIFSNLGEIIWQENFNIKNNSTCHIDISNQAKGIYFIKVNDKESIFTKKMIIK